MNIRQKKKRRNKFLAMNDFPREPFGEYQCPYCGWNSEYYDFGNPEAYPEGTFTQTGYGSFFNGAYSGHDWTEIYKCPICGTTFEFDNSDI